MDGLAGRFYLSRYYLMHRFKAVTGYSSTSISPRSGFYGRESLLRQGTPVMKAAELAGFRDYSTFLRAFQSTFHVSPGSSSRGPPRPPRPGHRLTAPDPERKKAWTCGPGPFGSLFTRRGSGTPSRSRRRCPSPPASRCCPRTPPGSCSPTGPWSRDTRHRRERCRRPPDN